MSANLDTDGEGSRVRIISEEVAPPLWPAPVSVHYFEAGIQKTIHVEMKLPTYFDKIVVSAVNEVLPSPPSPQIGLTSIRDALRLGYHTARRMESTLRSPRVIQHSVFDTRIWEPNNMSHLLLDLIPYSLYVRSYAGADVAILFRKLGSRFCELLELFGLVPIFEQRRIQANVIKIHGMRGLAVYDLDLRSTFDCPGIAFVGDVYSTMDFGSISGFDKIFLARRGPRSLLNHAEIEQLVGRFGYRTVFMEDYSLSEQLSIGANAKHVVAIHGAAMSFLAMSKHIDSVVELLPPNNYAACFPVSLGSRVKRYDQIIPTFDQTVAHSGWPTIARFKDMPFAVNIGLLDKLLSAIH
jgi:hypothetical protein